MYLYLQSAPAFWQLSQRRFMACAAIVAACGVISFVVGYIHRIRMLDVQKGWVHSVRRAFEILALSIVYASTLFLMSYMLFSLVNSIMGKAIFTSYIPALTAAFAGVSGYLTFVQAELMNAKTLSALLPFFVIAGVSTASSTTTDPHWFRNNFSELGDRTTFAARMFNTTLIMGGICIIIITYFAISELIATYRIVRPNGGIAIRQPNVSYKIPRFKVRITILSVMLVLSGVAFIGIGMFRYTPHPILHNVFARGMPVVMFIMLVALPWLAPQLSKDFFAISDLFACAIVNAARRLNLSIPEDLMIIGYDNVDYSMIASPTISTINTPKFQFGYTACELLIERIQNPDAAVQHISLPSELILRESTAGR